VSGPYKGGDFEPLGEFAMKVTFEGTNVAEGIRSMITHGIIDSELPLPPHLQQFTKTLVVVEE
jgi:hypothetical protein